MARGRKGVGRADVLGRGRVCTKVNRSGGFSSQFGKKGSRGQVEMFSDLSITCEYILSSIDRVEEALSNTGTRAWSP